MTVHTYGPNGEKDVVQGVPEKVVATAANSLLVRMGNGQGPLAEVTLVFHSDGRVTWVQC